MSTQALDWLKSRVEDPSPLIDLEGLEGELGNELGIQFKVEEKAELTGLLENPEFLEVVLEATSNLGVLIFRCLDEQPFDETQADPRKADFVHPRLSIPFHFDIQSKWIGEGNYLRWPWWSHAVQGLYHNPSSQGRVADTLITTTQAAYQGFETVRREEPILDEAIKRLAPTALPFTRKEAVIPMAWTQYVLNERKKEGFPIEECERIHQAIFKATPSLRIPWRDPAYSKGGTLVLWSAGRRLARTRPLVHARDNRGHTLTPGVEPPLMRFNLTNTSRSSEERLGSKR